MNSFGASSLRVGAHEYEIYRLDALSKQGFGVHRLPRRVSAQLQWRFRGTGQGLRMSAR